MPKRKADRPSDLFARRLRDLRDARGWSQRDFADELARLGSPTDRAIIARVETGQRGISLDEAILFAAVIGTSLENMIVPSDIALPGSPETVQIAGKLTAPARDVRLWLKGLQPLRSAEDFGAWLKAMPDGDLKAFIHFGLQPLGQAMQRLIEVLGVDDLDGAREQISGSRRLLDQTERRIDEIERQIDREENRDGTR
jgi:transcriptional regulator with XRE-family HTH domain